MIPCLAASRWNSRMASRCRGVTSNWRYSVKYLRATSAGQPRGRARRATMRTTAARPARRPGAADAAGRQHAEAGHPLVVDGREQGHVEPAVPKAVEQAGRDFQVQVDVRGRLVQAVNQRLGVEEAYAADAHRGAGGGCKS